MDLNAFPDTVLRAVFDRVPLLDLIRHIPLVCHRWHCLQPGVLSGKKNLALTIVVGKNALPNVKNQSVVVILFGEQLTNEDGSRMYPTPDSQCSLGLTTLTSKLVDSLISQLDGRSLTHLDLCISKTPPVTEAIPLTIRLLDHFARSLKTLKIQCIFSADNEKNVRVLTTVAVQMARLIEAVNRLPLLEHLTLGLLENLRLARPLDLPILARLKEFYFYSACPTSSYLFDSLKRYAELNDQLRGIRLGNKDAMEEYLAQFGQSSLAKRFTMLPQVISAKIVGVQVDPVQERFLNTFNGLTSLTMAMEDSTFVRLTTALAPLHSLVHLFLYGLEPITKFDTDPVDQIVPLKSVKALTLMARTETHKGLASKHWARMFPQMQIIMLYHYAAGCRICTIYGHCFDAEKVASCVRRTLLPFKKAFRRTLKKVYFCPGGDEGQIEVFTPNTIYQ